MSTNANTERLVERLVTYTIEVDGRLIVVEHVPARVNEETGERFFSPDTVERLQQIIDHGPAPTRMIEAAVFEFAA
jgi:YgiT-type zinc finger domain-containing protein